MTLEQFVTALSNAPFRWSVRYGRLRGTSVNSKDTNSYCPITALAKHTTGKDYDVSDWHRAAEVINLEYNLADCIARAADTQNEPGTNIFNGVGR